MTNVSIISTKDKTDKWPDKWVLNQIKKASGSDFTHTQTLIGGTLYESTYPGNFKKTVGYQFHQQENNLQQPLPRDMTAEEQAVLVAWWENKIKKGTRYGILKLFTYTILYKTKSFWNKLGWMPMSNDDIWGEFCSAAAILGLKYTAVGTGHTDLDILPNMNGEEVAPGDIVEALGGVK